MLKVENRESAHLKSRVKDLSVVPNLVSYTALLAAITPIAKANKNEVTQLYEPVLIRDTESLIANFGDPRIDPEKYIDLYTIMQMVGNGATVYLTKVDSGAAGVYEIDLGKVTSYATEPTTDTETVNRVMTGTSDAKVYTADELEYAPKLGDLSSLSITDGSSSVDSGFTYTVEGPSATGKYKLTVTFNSAPTATVTLVSYQHTTYAATITPGEESMYLNAYSSMTENIDLSFNVIQVKPFSLKAYYLGVEVKNGTSVIGAAKIKLDSTTSNQSIVNVLNANIGTYVRFELKDPNTASACIAKEGGKNSIAKVLLTNTGILQDNGSLNNFTSGTVVVDGITYPGKLISGASSTINTPNFNVTLNNYVAALNQYKDRKYAGCLMADLVAPMHSCDANGTNYVDVDSNEKRFGHPSYEERRDLHFALHNIAVERKDVNLVLSTPITENLTNSTILTVDDVCDWVASQGSKYGSLWEYSHTNTTDYNEQGFYQEIYYSWLYMQCAWIDNGKAKSKKVMVAPAGLVVNNILTSYRERGIHFPVAGDQYGTFADGIVPVYNPATKAERDQLVQYRINPIYDTGTRGVQIFGNETLNAGYTDLNAAHIARTLVYLRSTIDEYTEKLKFSINSLILWDTWKNYVTNYVLEPLRSAGALSSYSVAMGTDTTSPEEIANRMIKGNIAVTFYQSAEIFDLTYTVYSSATTVEAAQAAGY